MPNMRPPHALSAGRPRRSRCDAGFHHGLLKPPRDAFAGGPLDLDRFPAFDPGEWERIAGGRGVREVELRRIAGRVVLPRAARSGDGRRRGRPGRAAGRTTSRAEPDRLLVGADTMQVRDEPFSTASLLARLAAAAPDAPVVESAVLHEYDSYYYSRGRRTPLPVLRVKLAGPGGTRLYVDPRTSRLLASFHRLNRVERWLFNGLHSLDFAFWRDRRPLWDVGLIALSAGVLASSGIGLWVGLGRVRRAFGRMRARLSPTRRSSRRESVRERRGRDLWRSTSIRRPSRRTPRRRGCCRGRSSPRGTRTRRPAPGSAASAPRRSTPSSRPSGRRP